MSIRFKQAAGIFPNSDYNTGKGTTSASVAFRIKFNWPPQGGNAQPYFNGTHFTFATGTFNNSNNGLNVYFIWFPGDGTQPLANGMVYANTVNYIVASYDSADPSRQALWINGHKNLISNPSSQPFDANALTNMQVGVYNTTVSGTLDWEVEGLLWLLGYSLSDAEAAAIKNGADPSTIGVGAVQRNYWTFQGNPGDTVLTDDAAVANVLSPTQSYTSNPVTYAQEGTSITYGDSMPYVSPVGTGDIAVYSDGTAIRVGFTDRTTGTPLHTIGGSITTLPAIKVDGGSPITLERPLYNNNYTGVLLFLPDGQTIPKNAAVTFSADDAWIGTEGGDAVAATDLAIPNYSGKPVYGGLPPTRRVGWNFATDAPEWAFQVALKNLAKRTQIDDSITKRADGTVMENCTRFFRLCTQKNTNDETHSPIQLGKYAIMYDRKDADTTLSITSAYKSDWPRISLLSEYHNPGVDGVGVGDVYEIIQDGAAPATLAASCTDADLTITLAPNSTCIPPGDEGFNVQYAEIDGEYMLITAYDKSTLVATVTRGWGGTTAITHAANAAIVLHNLTASPSLSIQFGNTTTGEPFYDNLVIYGPGEFTLPDPPGPIVLDRSDAFQLDPPLSTKEALPDGIGVLRQMSATDGGYGLSCEPEHLRQDSELWPGSSVNFAILPNPISAKPATAANAPYVYNAWFSLGAEKYPVVLAADITTAPAAGTVETITITNDPANPVMATTRIELGSEVVRVLSVTGDAVSIVRGADKTTPTTHAAGTYQARWRIPTTDAAFLFPDSALIVYKTDANHGMWNRLMLTMGQSCDLNPLARINVTLTADVDATTTTFPVSVGASDAIHLTNGLYIVFDSECVRVTGPYDATAGTIPVERASASSSPGRPKIVGAGQGAAAHTANTVGTGSSSGVFCVIEDGSSYQWSDQAMFNIATMLTGPDTFILSFGFSSGGKNWSLYGDQTFDPIVAGSISTPSAYGPGGYSFAQAARNVAIRPGCDFWLNAPENASDDMVDDIAAMVLPNLPAGQHRVLVESGNEYWNYVTPRLGGANMTAKVCGYDNTFDPLNPGIDLLIYRGWAVAQRIKAAFAAVGRGDEIKFVVAWQQGSVEHMLNRVRALGLSADMDVISTAPYYLPSANGVNADLDAAYAASTDGQCLDIWKFNLEYNTSEIGSVLRNDGAARTAHEATVGRTIEFIEYEGGPDSYVTVPSDSDPQKLARNLDLNYHPNNVFASYDFPHILYRLGRVDGIALFDYVNGPFQNTPTHSYSLWGAKEWDGQPYGYGDGSDGKADNRLCLAQSGKTHSKPVYVNQAQTNVSTRVQAVRNYAADYAAYSPTTVDAEGFLIYEPLVLAGSASGPDSPIDAAGIAACDDLSFSGTATASTPINDATGLIGYDSIVFAGTGTPPVPDPVPFIGRKAVPRWLRF